MANMTPTNFKLGFSGPVGSSPDAKQEATKLSIQTMSQQMNQKQKPKKSKSKKKIKSFQQEFMEYYDQFSKSWRDQIDDFKC